MPADNDPLLGTVIDGRFEIRDKLGQGGMGTVYRAWQRSVGREVAIKLIDRSISNDPMATRRFLREAHLASQLSHPNTISVLDFGQMPDGRLFTAMELLRGRTLGRELRHHGPFPIERITRIGVQLCDALEAAHAQRIIHRDLKLDNVMVLDTGNDLIKVLDFGLAKTLDDTSTQATAAGIVVGTPRYIAPETAMTGDATPASDMYAVGVILGELALATPLWEGATLSVILQSQLAPEPVVARVPQPLGEVVARLLDPAPQRRPSAAETRAMLHAIRDGTPIEPPRAEAATIATSKRAKHAAQPLDERPTIPRQQRTTRSTRTYALLAAGTLVFVASVVVAYVATRRSDASRPPATKLTGVTAPATADRDVPIDDPWSEKPAPAPPEPSPDLSPILPPQQEQPVQLLFIGVPNDAVVTIDQQPADSTVAYVERGTRPKLVAVRQRDTQVLFEAKSITPDRDQTIDFRTKRFADCEHMLSSKSVRYCRTVYCARVPGDPDCAQLPPQ